MRHDGGVGPAVHAVRVGGEGGDSRQRGGGTGEAPPPRQHRKWLQQPQPASHAVNHPPPLAKDGAVRVQRVPPSASSLCLARRPRRPHRPLHEELWRVGRPTGHGALRIALLPLSKHLRLKFPRVLQPWCTDNSAMRGTGRDVATCFQELCRVNPQYGYFPEPKNLGRCVPKRISQTSSRSLPPPSSR